MDNRSGRLSLSAAREIDTVQNRVARGEDRYGSRANKNPHAVALGKMTSEAKKESSAKNGEKGGRPKGS